MTSEINKIQNFEHWVDSYQIDSVVLQGNFVPLVINSTAKLCCTAEACTGEEALDKISLYHRSLAAIAGEEVFGI